VARRSTTQLLTLGMNAQRSVKDLLADARPAARRPDT